MGPAAEQAVVQAAIARGYFTPAQVEELRKVHAQRAQSGKPAAFLTVMAERLQPPQRAVLQQIYQQGYDSATGPVPFDSDGATIDTTPQPQPAPKQVDEWGMTINSPGTGRFDAEGATVAPGTGRFDAEGATIDTGRYAAGVAAQDAIGETLLEANPTGPVFDVDGATQMLPTPEMAGTGAPMAPTVRGDLMAQARGEHTPPPHAPSGEHTPPPRRRPTGSMGEVGFRDLQTVIDPGSSNEDALDTLQPQAPTTGRMSNQNWDHSNPTGPGAVAPTLLEEGVGEVTDDYTHPDMPNDQVSRGNTSGLAQSLATAADSSGRQRKAEPARERIADYEVLSELGRGGMGVVYEARSVTLGRRVALKVLLSGGRAGGQEIERFKIEAKAAARLRHPNIVRLLEQGQDAEGHMYLAMDFIQGRSLHQVLKEDGPLEINEAARLTKLMAQALHYAHEQSILHRDIKPHNVLVDQHGVPYLTDFGLAKLVGDQSQSLTGAGTMMGTPGFMPPEQAGARGLKPDARSDVYSLGATLYCLLTGQPPFRAPTVGETLMLVMNKAAPPITKGRPEVPRDLETICLKCLEKIPEDRYQTAAELAADLDRFLGDVTIVGKRVGAATQASRWAGRHKALVAVVSLCVILGAGGGGFAINKAIQEDKAAEEIREQERLAKLEIERKNREAEAERKRKDAEAAAKAKRVEELAAAKARAEEERLAAERDRLESERAEQERLAAEDAARRRQEAEEAAAEAERLRLEEERLARERERVEGIDSSLKNDKTPPSIELLAPKGRDRYTKNTQIHIDLKITDSQNEVVKVELEGAKFTAHGDSVWQASWKLPAEGKNVGKVTATDKAGNAATFRVTAFRDTQPPKLKSLVRKPKGAEVTDKALAVLVALDDEGTVRIGDEELKTKWDAKREAHIAYRKLPLKLGENTIPLSAADVLGNELNLEPIVVRRVLPAVLRGAWWTVHADQEAYALEHEQPVWFANSLGMKFVLVPPGTFSMGSPDREQGREKKEEVRHQVTISKPFYVLSTEVTNAMFRRFRAEHDSGAFKGLGMNDDAQPAVKVSWELAREFCNWLSDQEGEPGLYRLPTEAEWEYACRAGTTTAFYWGEHDKAGRTRAKAFANCIDEEAEKTLNFASDTFPGDDRFVVTAPVGSFEPNGFGLYDMIGNAGEWVFDFHGDYPAGAVSDPKGVTSSANRVFRGGAWDSRPAWSRSAYRYAANPAKGRDINGFRVVATRAKPAR